MLQASYNWCTISRDSRGIINGGGLCGCGGWECPCWMSTWWTTSSKRWRSCQLSMIMTVSKRPLALPTLNHNWAGLQELYSNRKQWPNHQASKKWWQDPTNSPSKLSTQLKASSSLGSIILFLTYLCQWTRRTQHANCIVGPTMLVMVMQLLLLLWEAIPMFWHVRVAMSNSVSGASTSSTKIKMWVRALMPASMINDYDLFYFCFMVEK